tara:strand:+ start:834 stop:2084 length:1251 start_codon:yes stop_codon:yes gene_type:complete
MATYVNNLRLKEIATGDESGTWGTSTNTNLELIADALGYATEAVFDSDANKTTTVANGAADAARAMYYKATGSATLSASRDLTILPNDMSRVMFIENATTGSQDIVIKQGSGASVTIGTGKVRLVYLDGAGSGAAVIDSMTDAVVSDSFQVAGTTPTITIGDGGAEDTKILFDGNAQDFYVGLDDTADDFIIGLGSAVGTTPIISLTEAGAITLKGTVTTDDSPMALTLQTAETDLALNDVIGKIDFQAPDEAAGSDANLVAAGIEAVSEGDFSSSNNATKLSFKTAASEAAAEKMALSSAGNLTVTGTVTDAAGAIRAIPVNTEASTYELVAGDVGKVINSGGTVTVPASIFSAGDVITIFNNTAGSLTITCSAITTAYKAGTDTDVDSVTIDTRGVATILFITTTLCVISGDLG